MYALEGLAADQVIRQLGVGRSECFFWATHGGAELDLLVVRGNRRRGFELKRSSSPSVTPSMRSALKDLRLTSLDVIYPGDRVFLLSDRIRAVGLKCLAETVHRLR